MVHVDIASSFPGFGCGPVWMSVRPAMQSILYCSRSSSITPPDREAGWNRRPSRSPLLRSALVRRSTRPARRVERGDRAGAQLGCLDGAGDSSSTKEPGAGVQGGYWLLKAGQLNMFLGQKLREVHKCRICHLGAINLAMCRGRLLYSGDMCTGEVEISAQYFLRRARCLKSAA